MTEAKPPSVAPCAASAEAPVVVLDTNVWLDLLLFEDARAASLLAALIAGQVTALSTQPMRDELADVLSRPFASGRTVAPEALPARAAALSQLIDSTTLAGRCALKSPRCSDPDDQKFIDLAWAWPAAWLISHDRALLTLARPAWSRGLAIGTPAAWALANGLVRTSTRPQP